MSVRYLWLHRRYYTSLRGSTGVNGHNARLRMEAIKSIAVLRSYSTSPMVLALAIVIDLALALFLRARRAICSQRNRRNTAAVVFRGGGGGGGGSFVVARTMRPFFSSRSYLVIHVVSSVSVWISCSILLLRSSWKKSTGDFSSIPAMAPGLAVNLGGCI